MVKLENEFEEEMYKFKSKSARARISLYRFDLIDATVESSNAKKCHFLDVVDLLIGQWILWLNIYSFIPSISVRRWTRHTYTRTHASTEAKINKVRIFDDNRLSIENANRHSFLFSLRSPLFWAIVFGFAHLIRIFNWNFTEESFSVCFERARTHTRTRHFASCHVDRPNSAFFFLFDGRKSHLCKLQWIHVKWNCQMNGNAMNHHHDWKDERNEWARAQDLESIKSKMKPKKSLRNETEKWNKIGDTNVLQHRAFHLKHIPSFAIAEGRTH